MRILIFSWRGPGHPNAGGAETSTHEHTKGWVGEGNEVTLFTSSYLGAKKEEFVDGVKIIRRGRQVLGVHWEAFKWYLFGKHNDFDLVVDQFHGIPFFSPLFVRKKKLGFIHEVTREVWWMNPWPTPFNLIPAIFGSILEPLLFKILYRGIPFLTVSQSTKKDLMEWGIPEKNVTVVHNGVNIPNIKKLPQKENKKTAIFLGAISKDKGIEDALKIFSEIDKKQKDWQFWVVGKAESHYQDYLKNLAKILGLQSKLKFLGYVADRKKFELLSRAHILVNPSIREGWGLVVIEAAAVGTPTIGYDVPGLRDSIQNGRTGILSAINPQSCSEEVLDLFRDKEKYENLTRNCINWSKKFDWQKSSTKSLNLIKKIVANKP